MYMEVLILDGKSYVKASKAAKDLGYATDYVGQLCRSGQVDSHLIGRTWYVNQDELSTHKVEKKRMSRVKAREYAKKSIAESKVKITETQNNYTKVAIRYEHDGESLLPETKKVSIVSELPRRELQEIPQGDELHIENKGEKVRMSGKLSVVDVTDSPIDSDMTVLRPRIISVVANDNAEKSKVSEKKVVQKEVEIVKPKISFVERLEESHVHIEKNTETLETEENENVAIPQEMPKTEATQQVQKFEEKKDIPTSISVAIVLVVLVVSMLSTALYQHIEYTPDDSGTIISKTSFKFSIDMAKEIISSKI